jgi:hypothetical protein
LEVTTDRPFALRVFLNSTFRNMYMYKYVRFVQV